MPGKRGRPELEGEPGLSPYGLLLVQRGLALTYTGHPADGARSIERAIELGRRRGERELVAFASLCRVVPCGVMEEPEQAFAHAQRALEAAESSANTFLRALSRSAIGQAHIASGRWPEAIESLTDLVAAIRAGRAAPLVEMDSIALLAEAQLGTRDLAAARATAETALAIARQFHRPLAELRAQLVRARVLTASAEGDAIGSARAALDAATALVDRTGAVVFTPFLGVARAELAARMGDDRTRDRELREAERLFTAMGALARAAGVARCLRA